MKARGKAKLKDLLAAPPTPAFSPRALMDAQAWHNRKKDDDSGSVTTEMFTWFASPFTLEGLMLSSSPDAPMD